eukprot:scaffold112844_cov27-Tisochrysis_lutea.AAC.4
MHRASRSGRSRVDGRQAAALTSDDSPKATQPMGSVWLDMKGPPPCPPGSLASASRVAAARMYTSPDDVPAKSVAPSAEADSARIWPDSLVSASMAQSWSTPETTLSFPSPQPHEETGGCEPSERASSGAVACRPRLHVSHVAWPSPRHVATTWICRKRGVAVEKGREEAASAAVCLKLDLSC